MRLTLAFITGRAEPHLDWLITSLAPQLVPGDEIEVLVIDMRGRTPAQLSTSDRPFSGVNVRVALPKPTPWQGAYRVTSCDFWAKSSAMNTAFVLCETDYIAFADDSCRLGPRWLASVRSGARDQIAVLAGAFVKTEGGTEDHRLHIEPEGKEDCGGGWLYGCTFALPLAWALDVNGAEEGCDGMGAEDYTLGLMAENAGHRIDFVPDMLVTQTRTEIFTPGVADSALRRLDKGTAPADKSNAALTRFRARARTEVTPDLRLLRAQRAAGEAWPLPDPDQRDWFDQELIRDL